MKLVFLLLPALVVSVPAHALSIVSLHVGPSVSSFDAAIVIVSVLALGAVIGFRVLKR